MKLRLFPLLACLVGFSSIATTGCVTAVVASGAVGTVAYVRGALRTNVDANVQRTAKAADRAVASLGLVAVSSKSDSLTGEIIARTSDDTRVVIALRSITPTTTQIDIRVGTFGDRNFSNRILDEIKGRL
jgi:hypothetical protein